MPLPILSPTDQPTAQTLVRLFHQTETNWLRHLAEEQVLDWGTALFNPQLPQAPQANLIMDARLPTGMEPPEAIAFAQEFYQERGTSLGGLIPSPSDASEALVNYLLSQGWSVDSREILRLARFPGTFAITAPPDIKIIPARASFRHARQLAEEKSGGNAEQTDAALLHLDDPHVDALLALRDGHAVAGISVLAMGEIGRIEQLYVAEKHRRRHLGTLMVNRALEICARALFKHVLLASSSEQAAQALFKQSGFEAVGSIRFCRAPR